MALSHILISVCAVVGSLNANGVEGVDRNTSQVNCSSALDFNPACYRDIVENVTELVDCYFKNTSRGSDDTDASRELCETSTPSTTSSGEAVVRLIDQGILSREQYELGEIVCRYLFYPLVISALIINAINIVVYSDRAMRSPTSVYLTALHVSEVSFTVLSLFRPALKAYYGVDAVKKQLYLISAMYNSNVVLATVRRLMYCFTVLVSTERFVAVAFPLKARSFRLAKSPIVFIISFTLFCFICHLPGAFKYDIIQKPNSEDYTIKRTTLYTNHGDIFLSIQTANKIVFTYVVILLGLLMNLFVLIALKLHTKNRQKMNTSVDAEKAAKREKQTTVTILTSTCVFTVLAIPLATDSLVLNFTQHYNMYRREHYMNLLMKDINNLLILFSLSTDFVSYMLLSKAYRRTFFRRVPFMVTLCRRKKNRERSSVAMETNISTISTSGTNMA